jgi:hypothetical protein
MVATAAPCSKAGTNRGCCHEAAQYIKPIARGRVERAEWQKNDYTLSPDRGRPTAISQLYDLYVINTTQPKVIRIGLHLS